jgi:nicotinamide phosphoribosyltransferase
MKVFAIHAADFYKTGHVYQYPDGTELVYANSTPRGARYANLGPGFDNKVVFQGLQGVVQWLLIDLWNDTFFKLPKEIAVGRYKRRVDQALGSGAVTGENFEKLHDLGYMPLRIKALPEGARVNLRVPFFTVCNTHSGFAWLTNFIETQLAAETWKTITVATIAYEFRKVIDRYAGETGADSTFSPWQGHDFSMRGMSGIHDAAQSGTGHLLSFLGTDTIPAIDYLEEYYPEADPAAPAAFIGGSVPATEHSVMCMGGKAGEYDTYRRLINDVYPSGIVSIVSDTWDFWHIVTVTIPSLKQEILNRKPNALGLCKVVLRPDSGDPVKIVCGDPEAPEGSPAFKGAVECLWETFGGTTTDKGFRVLDSHIGLIYGDSITLERAYRILDGMKAKGFASSNIVFGIGSYTYQGNTRDTFGQAIKATYGVVKGEGRELEKDPKTDDGVKKSAKGLLRVERKGDDYILHNSQTWEQERQGELRVIFENGAVFNRESTSRIRERLHGGRFFG